VPETVPVMTLQRTAAHCSTLQQHTAAYCSTLQHTATATHCNTLQHTAAHCSTLQHTATQCSTLQHNAPKWGCAQACACDNTATHCNTLQHTATHCNTLQHSVDVPEPVPVMDMVILVCILINAASSCMEHFDGIAIQVGCRVLQGVARCRSICEDSGVHLNECC